MNLKVKQKLSGKLHKWVDVAFSKPLAPFTLKAMVKGLNTKKKVEKSPKLRPSAIWREE